MGMHQKIRLGVLFGGKSAEHEVSLQSARNVIEAADKERYDIVLIGIDKQGRWHLGDASTYLLDADSPRSIKLGRTEDYLAMVPGDDPSQLICTADKDALQPLDVIFPILHGPFGEDGTVQGLLKLANIPCVGAGVLGSAVGMDKDVMKRLLRDAGIPIAKFCTFHLNEADQIDFADVKHRLGEPLFIKPANMGSSVGVHKVSAERPFKRAIEDAFCFDNKVLVEEFIEGREIECSILGNANPIASVPGEILPRHEFYSYTAKYIDENGAVLQIPAEMPDTLVSRVQQTAIQTFKTLVCEGMARVDMFLRADDEIIVNEINTIPGFTRISMYPKLWEASGISYGELIDRLVDLAIDRHEHEQKLKTDYLKKE
jgi:D-alanine-D-alanine ligase